MERLATKEAIEWLVEDAQDEPGQGYTGFAPEIGESCTWVLHAMYEWRGDFPELSHDEVRRMAVAAGEVEPQEVNGVSIEHLTNTGIPLGRTGRPGPEYDRLFWRDWAARVSAPMAASGVAPCFRWFPKGSSPARILSPAVGSIDRVSFSRVFNHLVAESSDGEAAQCFAYYGPLPNDFSWESSVIFEGPLSELLALYDSFEYNASPTKIWPPNRSWFVYTDWDLMATRISGSRKLISRLDSDPELETLVYP